MVAELLRLRLRLLANLFRRRTLGQVIGILVALALIAAAYAGVRVIASSGPEFSARSIVGLGAFASLAALLVPIITARRELMPARAFLGYPVQRIVLALVLAGCTLIGPALLVLPVALAPVAVWRGPDAAVAVGCGLLLFVQTLLSLRIGAAIGAALRTRRRLRGWLRTLAVVLLAVAAVPPVAAILTRVFLLLPDRIAPGAHVVLAVTRPVDASPAIDLLASSSLGVLWAAPAFRDLDQAGRVGAAVLTGVATILVLAVVWGGVVLLQLRATRPQPRNLIATRTMGLFGVVSTPTGAIAARSFRYWMRDPRYRAVFVILPVIPILMFLALWIGGVPFSTSVLIPLPVMVLVLAWSTSHNDVAYDSTALWQHLASNVRGIQDRVGRMWPPLVFGLVLVLVGSPLTAWGHGDGGVLPAVLGVNIAVLLAGIGVGSGLSARFPYAAPRPGDGPFRYPQVAGTSGGTLQGLSLLFIVLAVAPSVVAAAFCLAGSPGPWSWISLLAGILVGGITLVLGIVGGARAFDRRGPELLAFAMRN